MNDFYDHADSNIVYVIENVPGPHEDSVEYEEMMKMFESQISAHCNCKGTCSENCCCLGTSVAPNYITASKTGKTMLLLNYEEISFENKHITECNCLCQCSDLCVNRLVQKGPIENLYVKSCKQKLKGLGLFTRAMIPKGAFICEYAGEVITKSEALRRHHRNDFFKEANYIFCLNEHCDEKVVQTFVDPSTYGNIGRYINHSCEPNCCIIPVRVDSLIPKLAIFSTEVIMPHSEITFDYGSQNSDEKTPETSAAVQNRKKCYCQSKNCRGYLPVTAY